MKRIRISGIGAFVLAAGAILGQQRFDMIVRDDFFAGFAGNKEAFARAMRVTEDALQRDPKHAEAKVWHGAGVLYQSSESFRKGDFQNGGRLWQQALDEMAAAVQLAPSDVAVLIPRGASLIATTRFAPADFGRPVLETGVFRILRTS